MFWHYKMSTTSILETGAALSLQGIQISNRDSHINSDEIKWAGTTNNGENELINQKDSANLTI